MDIAPAHQAHGKRLTPSHLFANVHIISHETNKKSFPTSHLRLFLSSPDCTTQHTGTRVILSIITVFDQETSICITSSIDRSNGK